MGLFDGIPLPRFLNPAEYSLQSEQASASIGHAFLQGMQLAVNSELQKKQLDAQITQWKANTEMRAAQLDAVRAQAEDIPKIMEWAKDPTKPPPTDLRSGQSIERIAQIQTNFQKSSTGRSLLEAQNSYFKKLESLSEIDRITIEAQMRDENQDGQLRITPNIAKNIDDAYQRRPIDSASIRDVQEVFRLEDEAKAIDATDPDKALQLREQAALLKEKFLGAKETIETYTDESGHQQVRVVKGGGTTAKSPTEPTVGFKGKLQEQLHSYDDAMSTVAHIEQNMNASDFGIRGVAKEAWSKIGGQLGAPINPEQMDVRKAVRTLRASLYKSLRSDSNITEAERKQIEQMLPSPDITESLPDAIAALGNVKRELTNKATSAAQRLGVAPPGWVSAEAIRQAFKEGRMTEEDAKAALIKFHANELK